MEVNVVRIIVLFFEKKRTVILTVTHYVISVRIRSLFGSHFPVFGPEKLRIQTLLRSDYSKSNRNLTGLKITVFSEVF